MLNVVGFTRQIGQGILFLKELFCIFKENGVNRRHVYDQIWLVTLQSAGIMAVAGFFVGGLATVQFTAQVKQFGALGFLGGLSTSATVREVGPLLIAFMLSGKVGAYTSAELGTMKVTEQLDAIRCLGADPLEEIILPRFIAIIVSSFFLLMLGLAMSFAGGALMAMAYSGINLEEYFRHVPTILTGYSLLNGVFKCLVFAFVLASVCTFKGYTTTGGARGVGQAVVATAVITMVGLVVFDWWTSFLSETFLSIIAEL